MICHAFYEREQIIWSGLFKLDAIKPELIRQSPRFCLFFQFAHEISCFLLFWIERERRFCCSDRAFYVLLPDGFVY